MQWDATPTAGFCPSGCTPWLPLNANAPECNVAIEVNDPASMLSLYRELLALRRKSIALRQGQLAFVAGAPPDVLAFTRTAGAENIAIVCNFAGESRNVALRNPALLLASIGGVEVRHHTVGLPPFAAALVRLEHAAAACLP
jgi:alpha-glucosidase